MDQLPNLPASVSREIRGKLARALLRLPGESPEDHTDRIDNAMLAVAALNPADAYEAKMASQVILAHAAVEDAFIEAAEYSADPAQTHRCRAQAASLMRQQRALTRDLERRQAAREKAYNESHPAAMERAGWWFRGVSELVPEATPAEPAPAAPEPVQDDDKFSRMSAAEKYAVMYPRRAAEIRAAGGLPPNCKFGPPEEWLIREIITSTSPLVTAVDQPQHATA